MPAAGYRQRTPSLLGLSGCNSRQDGPWRQGQHNFVFVRELMVRSFFHETLLLFCADGQIPVYVYEHHIEYPCILAHRFPPALLVKVVSEGGKGGRQLSIDT